MSHLIKIYAVSVCKFSYFRLVLKELKSFFRHFGPKSSRPQVSSVPKPSRFMYMHCPKTWILSMRIDKVIEMVQNL